MEMEDQYGIADLRQLISRSGNQFPPPYPPQPPPELFSHHHHNRGLSPPQQQPHYDMLVMGGGRHLTPEPPDMFNPTQPRGPGVGVHHQLQQQHQQQHHHHQDQLNCDSTTTTAGGFDGGDGGSARWPRQETLTLLEVRSRLHHKFKEANQKGPLWDELARIMSEEHGYQRSGKKCREKFENLYKYYKKTKEGKAGRQDGKHYRFFRQLEALYGSSTSDDTHISQNTPHFHFQNQNQQPPLSNSSNELFDPSSSGDDDDHEPSMESNGSGGTKAAVKKNKRSNWKGKIKDFIDLQMRKIMEKQEAWLEKTMKTLEGREQERFAREEEWRTRQEAARVEREHKFWETERAWIQARDSALIKALDKITHPCPSLGPGPGPIWSEQEITRLIQLRTNMESRLQQCGISEEVLWEDIATKMAYFGYERGAIGCKDKWDSINKEFQDKGISRKRKEDYSSTNYDQGGLYNNQLNGFNNCEI